MQSRGSELGSVGLAETRVFYCLASYISYGTVRFEYNSKNDAILALKRCMNHSSGI